MRLRSRFVLPLLVVMLAGLLLALSGCDETDTVIAPSATGSGNSAEETMSTEVAATTSQAPAGAAATTTTSKATATTLASTEVKLANGNIKSLGFIHDMWTDAQGHHLTIDYCDILYWDEATAAARAAGAIAPTEETPVYVRNQSTRLREWSVSTSVDLVTCTRVYPWDPNPDPPCSWVEFVTFWQSQVDSLGQQGASGFYGPPFWIERDGDTVIRITEQFMS